MNKVVKSMHSKLISLLVILSMIFTMLPTSLVSGASDTNNATSARAVFYVLLRGYERPNGSASDSTAKYRYAGVGTIADTVVISNNDSAVAANIVAEPDCSSILKEGEKIVWYVIKHETDGWHVDGEIVSVDDDSSNIPSEESGEGNTDPSTEEPTTEEVPTVATTTAHFALLNRGYERPTTTKSEATSKYTVVGDGKIYNAVETDNDDDAVAANIAVAPDVSKYLGEGEEVIWYVIKKEADGWHVDGEIVSISIPSVDSAPTPVEPTTEETIPDETTPDETTTNEPTTEETTPVETTPVETTPVETEPVETEPVGEVEPLVYLRNLILKMLVTGDMNSYDISSYHFTFKQVDSVWNDVVANEGYIAHHTYASAYLGNTRNSDNTIATIVIKNSDSKFVNRYNTVLSVIDYIKSNITEEMSDLEKVLYVHDYIVSHCYYKQVGLITYNAGSVLGYGYGVCQGYADALMLILRELGIKTYMMSSTSMNHAWVYAYIDGELYHIDPTWNDTSSQIAGEVSHRYLIRNDYEFEFSNELPRKHKNWYCSKLTSDQISTSEKYTDWFVHDVVGNMCYYNSYWYYSSDYCIKYAKIDGSGMKTLLDFSNTKATVRVISIEDNVLNYSVNNKAYSLSLE